MIDGSCPHAKTVPQEYIQDARISALHFVAAVGPPKALDFSPEQVSYAQTYNYYLYELDPYLLALLKNSIATASMPSMKYMPYSVHHDTLCLAERMGNVHETRVFDSQDE